jgi:predicted nucleotidyltransferase
MLFNGTVKWKILARFFEEPEKEFYVKELARDLKIGAGSASKICKELAGEGILECKAIGRALFYFLKNKDPFIQRLKSSWFLQLIIGFRDCWEDEEMQSVALYGSRASGEFISKSDIDILIISNLNEKQIDKQLQKLRNKFQEKLSITIMTISEWRDLAKKKDRFYIEVLSNHILLYGSSLVIG